MKDIVKETGCASGQDEKNLFYPDPKQMRLRKTFYNGSAYQFTSGVAGYFLVGKKTWLLE